MPARGEVWWCDVPTAGRRPVIVLSRDAAIPALRRVLVAPCTTTVRNLASEVALDPVSDGVPRPCVANLDSVESVSVGVLVDRIGRIGPVAEEAVCGAMLAAIGCD